jgi:hypothetical protein
VKKIIEHATDEKYRRRNKIKTNEEIKSVHFKKHFANLL